jgi:hypothetical protein
LLDPREDAVELACHGFEALFWESDARKPRDPPDCVFIYGHDINVLWRNGRFATNPA